MKSSNKSLSFTAFLSFIELGTLTGSPGECWERHILLHPAFQAELYVRSIKTWVWMANQPLFGKLVKDHTCETRVCFQEVWLYWFFKQAYRKNALIKAVCAGGSHRHAVRLWRLERDVQTSARSLHLVPSINHSLPCEELTSRQDSQPCVQPSCRFFFHTCP